MTRSYYRSFLHLLTIFPFLCSRSLAATSRPTAIPSAMPTPLPSSSPSALPSALPTISATTTKAPSPAPTLMAGIPSASPTLLQGSPTVEPTLMDSPVPTQAPTAFAGIKATAKSILVLDGFTNISQFNEVQQQVVINSLRSSSDLMAGDPTIASYSEADRRLRRSLLSLTLSISYEVEVESREYFDIATLKEAFNSELKLAYNSTFDENLQSAASGLGTTTPAALNYAESTALLNTTSIDNTTIVTNSPSTSPTPAPSLFPKKKSNASNASVGLVAIILLVAGAAIVAVILYVVGTQDRYYKKFTSQFRSQSAELNESELAVRIPDTASL